MVTGFDVLLDESSPVMDWKAREFSRYFPIAFREIVVLSCSSSVVSISGETDVLVVSGCVEIGRLESSNPRAAEEVGMSGNQESCALSERTSRG